METFMIHINARAIIASSNFAKDFLPITSDKRPTVMNLQTGNGPYTVLGNLSNGLIFTNNAELGLPWQPLNQSILF